MMTETRLEEHDLHGLHNYLPNRSARRCGVRCAGRTWGRSNSPPRSRPSRSRWSTEYPEAIRAGALALAQPRRGAARPIACSATYFPPRDKGKTLSGSTDVAEVSWIAPTVQLTTACFALGVPGHSWGITATGGMSIGHKGMLHAAKAMAITGARLHASPGHPDESPRGATARRPAASPIARRSATPSRRWRTRIGFPTKLEHSGSYIAGGGTYKCRRPRRSGALAAQAGRGGISTMNEGPVAVATLIGELTRR